MAEVQVSKSGGFVAVACKIPNGLFLHIDKFETVNEPVMGGGTREVKRAVQSGDKIEIKGPALKFGETPTFVIAGGYAITKNVPADFFSEWLKQNKDSEIVKQKLVMAAEKSDYLASQAKEHKAILSGLQPLKPGDDIRIPKIIKKPDEKED